jgi:hypothetical protein
VSLIIRGTLGFVLQPLDFHLRFDASLFALPSLTLLNLTLLTLETIQLVLVELASATSIARARAGVAATTAA